MAEQDVLAGREMEDKLFKDERYDGYARESDALKLYLERQQKARERRAEVLAATQRNSFRHPSGKPVKAWNQSTIFNKKPKKSGRTIQPKSTIARRGEKKQYLKARSIHELSMNEIKVEGNFRPAIKAALLGFKARFNSRLSHTATDRILKILDKADPESKQDETKTNEVTALVPHMSLSESQTKAEQKHKMRMRRGKKNRAVRSAALTLRTVGKVAAAGPAKKGGKSRKWNSSVALKVDRTALQNTVLDPDLGDRFSHQPQKTLMHGCRVKVIDGGKFIGQQGVVIDPYCQGRIRIRLDGVTGAGKQDIFCSFLPDDLEAAPMEVPVTVELDKEATKAYKEKLMEEVKTLVLQHADDAADSDAMMRTQNWKEYDTLHGIAPRPSPSKRSKYHKPIPHDIPELVNQLVKDAEEKERKGSAGARSSSDGLEAIDHTSILNLGRSQDSTYFGYDGRRQQLEITEEEMKAPMRHSFRESAVPKDGTGEARKEDMELFTMMGKSWRSRKDKEDFLERTREEELLSKGRSLTEAGEVAVHEEIIRRKREMARDQAAAARVHGHSPPPPPAGSAAIPHYMQNTQSNLLSHFTASPADLRETSAHRKQLVDICLENVMHEVKRPGGGVDKEFLAHRLEEYRLTGYEVTDNMQEMQGTILKLAESMADTFVQNEFNGESNQRTHG